jgi:hypothetical protein
MADPYKAAQPFFRKEEDLYNRVYNPIMERGNTAGESAAGQYNRMSQDPNSYYKEIERGYTPRLGYEDYERNPAYRTLQNEARAGGYAGTEYDRNARARLMHDLEEKDFQAHIDRILGINKTGLEGETHFADQGNMASHHYAENLGGLFQDQGDLAYKQEQEKQARKDKWIQALIQGGFALGGAALSGPIGGKLGSMFGGGDAGGGYTGTIGGQTPTDFSSWGTSTAGRFPGRGSY